MRRLGIPTLIALSLLGAPGTAGAQERCPGGKTALVLAGGGAKGMVHLGVIRMLDSLGVRPDFVIGTSMGAIVGALYASGYSSRDLDSLAGELPLAELVRPRTPPPPRAYPLYRPLVYWEIDEGHIRLAPAAVPEQGIDAALNRVLLRGNLQARGDFGRLPIPFYAVATDLATQRAVALHEGDLAQAVRASVAIPLVFEPVRIGDRTLADGGLAANVPVRLARELGADRVIISDMVRRQTTLVDFSNPFTVATALIDYLFSQEGDSAMAGDILIATDVSRIGNLDFTAATLDTLVRRGVREARAALVPADRCLPHAPPAAQHADSTAERVTQLQVPGFSKRELEDLLGTLGLAQGIILDPGVLRRGFDDFARDGRFRSVWLNPTPTDSGVALDLRVRRSPQGGIGAGIAYDNELGARMWTGGVLRDPVTKSVELTGILSFGGLRRELQAAVRRRLYLVGRPSVMASVFLGQEEIPYFTPEGEPFFRPRLSLATGTVGLEWPVGAHWLLRVAEEARTWSDTAKAGHEALVTSLLAQHATEDGEVLMLVEAQWSPQFRRAAIDWQGPIELGRWTITPGLRAGTIQGREIPVMSRFPLGGFDGFPGLRLLERRGDHELVVSNAFSYALAGPLRVQAEVSAGDSRADGPGVRDDLLRGKDWLVGWRVGLGIRTSPLGPIRLEYGATSIDGDYRDQVFLRVGRWF